MGHHTASNVTFHHARRIAPRWPAQSGGVRQKNSSEGSHPTMFQVEYDRFVNRLNIIVKGFWSPEDVPALAAAIGDTVQQARTIRDDFNVLVESFDFPVQANNVADMLTNVMTGGMALTSGRAAVVVGSQLNRAQAERTLVHPRVRVFMTVEDAEHWLAETATSL